MFSKKKNRGLKAVTDGIEQIQLYICPHCGKKSRFKPYRECVICGVELCEDCFKKLEFHWYEGKFYLCQKHYKWLKTEVEHLIKLKRQDKSEEDDDLL